jgi:hypothetical protein
LQADADFDALAASPDGLEHLRAEASAAIAEDEANPDQGLSVEAFRKQLLAQTAAQNAAE